MKIAPTQDIHADKHWIWEVFPQGVNEQPELKHIRTSFCHRLSQEITTIEADANPKFRNQNVSIGRHHPPLAAARHMKSCRNIWTEACSCRAGVDQRVHNLDRVCIIRSS